MNAKSAKVFPSTVDHYGRPRSCIQTTNRLSCNCFYSAKNSAKVFPSNTCQPLQKAAELHSNYRTNRCKLELLSFSQEFPACGCIQSHTIENHIRVRHSGDVFWSSGTEPLSRKPSVPLNSVEFFFTTLWVHWRFGPRYVWANGSTQSWVYQSSHSGKIQVPCDDRNVGFQCYILIPIWARRRVTSYLHCNYGADSRLYRRYWWNVASGTHCISHQYDLYAGVSATPFRPKTSGDKHNVLDLYVFQSWIKVFGCLCFTFSSGPLGLGGRQFVSSTSHFYISY